jgi:hypothetical protein
MSRGKNLKRFFVIFLWFFTTFVSATQCQVITWEKTYGGNRMEWAQSIQQASDGGYIK